MFASKVIKEGDVQHIPTSLEHYNREDTWKAAHLKLLAGGILEISGKGVKSEKIVLAPQISASRSVSANFPTVFVVNTHEESKFTGGPLFSVADPKEAEEWIHAINLERVRHAHKTAHPHPLTYYVPRYVLKYETEPVTFTQIPCKEDTFPCDNCKKPAEYGGGICEFCNYKICSNCEEGFKAIKNMVTVKSPEHEHELHQFEKAQGVEWFPSEYDGSFRCDKCKTESNGIVFHCIECGTYDECEKCAAAYLPDLNGNNDNSEMRLNYDLFKDAMRVVDNKDYAVNNSKKLSKACSVITPKPWDLSKIETEPVPHAYLEVKFNSYDHGQKIGVGIGNQVHIGNQMLGYQQNSYGYFNDGSVSQHGRNEWKNYLPKFTDGDTVGVGILMDSYHQRRLFFTKNGKMLEYFPTLIHKGMDVFPGVSFAQKAAANFSVNFKGPFLFDTNSIPNYRADTENRMTNIPPELVAMCLSFAASSPGAVLEYRLVSKLFAEQAVSNAVWQPLFMKKWPLQNSKLKLKSWHTLFKRRFAVDTTSSWDDESVVNKNKLIENCDFEFLCPLKWSQLPDNNGNQNERHCDKCNKTVYRVDDEATLRSYAEKGRCVSMFKPEEPGHFPRPRMMGMPPARPRNIPDPVPSAKPKPAPTDKKPGLLSKLFNRK